MPRFHLSFDYIAQGRSWRNHGDQVVITDDSCDCCADNIEHAARVIAKDRGLIELHVRQRYFYGRPASESETIDRTFRFNEERP